MSASPAPAPTNDAGPLKMEEPRPGVLRLILADPPANALSEAMLDALRQALDGAARDESVRAIVIAAEGRLFCAGHDLKEMTERRAQSDGGRAAFRFLFARCSSLMQAIVELPKPVVAEVGGLATAAGCQLVASCDIAVASTEARFGVNGIDVGLFCSTPMVALSRNVPPKIALDLLMTGEMLSAERALAAGLVSRVVPPDRLGAETDAVLDLLLARPARVLALGKAAFRRQLGMELADAYRFASGVIVDNMLMDEAKEGIGAFIGKREPNWDKS